MLQNFLIYPKYIVSRAVGSFLPVGENLDSLSSNESPLGLRKLNFLPQEAFVISVPTYCQVRLTATLWSEKSSAYKLLKVSSVIYDYEIALNKVKYSKNFQSLLLNQYRFQNYFCISILSYPPASIQKNLIPP